VKKNPEFIIDFYERRSPFQRVINERLLGVPDELRIMNCEAVRNAAADLEPMDTGVVQSVDETVQEQQQEDINDSSGAVDSAAVSYSIPLPGVGNIAIDVPILEATGVEIH